jgi:multiple sugar transport system substrate-binding protein
MLEAANFNPWLEAAGGYLSPALVAYKDNPVWTSDPKRTIYRDIAWRSRTAGGLGSIGEKAASAISDFVLVDMFASHCTGREDAKGAIRTAERQLQRIYR